LKRRKVVRAALVYGAGAFAVLQVADIVIGPLGLPDAVMTVLVWLTIVGFVVTVVVSWFVDISSNEGTVSQRWVSGRTAFAAAALVAVGVGVAWVLRPSVGQPAAGAGASAPAAGAATEGTLVVLPFTVLGSPSASYLSEAVAKLLATSLDGVAGLHSVSPHALMGYPAIRDGAPATEALAREVAEHFGAALWILGDVLEAGDSLRIAATLVDRRAPSGAPESTVSASVTAASDDLFTSVDQLAALLLAEREAGAGSERTRTAARTTTSLEALRAYLEGERAFRTGSYLPAVAAFSRAAAADTTFALAFYRLSMAQERLAWAEASRISAEAAYRHADRLAPREREFLEAVVALRRGNTSEAEQMLRSHVRVHPTDPEAWYQLGEILFHGEPLRGGSMSAAREPLERALVYDPGDLGALYHLVRIAIKDGDQARLDSLAARFVALSPGGERTLELRALQAATRDAEDTFEAILAEMGSSPDPFLPIAVWSMAVFGQDPARGEAIARLMTAADRPRDVQAAGHLQLAYLAMARGRHRTALEHLDQAEAMGDPDARESRAWFLALPWVDAAPGALADTVRALAMREQGAIAESDNPSSFFSAQNGVHGLVNLYLRGILGAGAGHETLPMEVSEDLRGRGETEGERQLARQLADGVEAQHLVHRGAPDEAMALLSGLRIEGWYELTFVSPYFASSLERFTLAELLVEAGRDAEALGWYQGLRENNVPELVFLGPALLREAAIHRRAGRGADADRLRARFDDLWSAADPELRQAVLARYGG
jgi:tetratricopeptide (TPR) repeat protein